MQPEFRITKNLSTPPVNQAEATNKTTLSILSKTAKEKNED